MPERIQLRRTKGWRMPPNTVKVDRSTLWGNPFTLEKHPFAGFLALDIVGPRGDRTQKEWRRAAVAACYEQWVRLPEQAELREKIVSGLRGKDLACWCPLGQPCHGDTLLEIANAASARAITETDGGP